MKKSLCRGLFPLLLCALFSVFLLAGCGTMGEEDTPEITVSYLENSYAQQLMNDGAEKLLGSVELNRGESGELEMILHPKDLVSDDSQPGGLRIDSYALNRTFVLPEQAYITFLPEGQDGEPQILTPEEFYTAVSEEYELLNTDFTEYGDHILYDVYALDDQVLLVLAHPIQ